MAVLDAVQFCQCYLRPFIWQPEKVNWQSQLATSTALHSSCQWQLGHSQRHSKLGQQPVLGSHATSKMTPLIGGPL